MPENGGKTAFVFAGGGSLGAVQVGMLRALVEHGLIPDLVVGASVGAINGAFFAARPNANGVEALATIWLGLQREDVFPFNLWQSLYGLLTRRNHLLAPRALRQLIKDTLPFDRLEQAALPLHIVTTDLLDGEEVLLSSGDAQRILLASAAIPVIFPPVCHGVQWLVDGGVASNTPIAAACKLGATRVIVLPTGISCALAHPPDSMLAMAFHAINLMTMRQMIHDLQQFAARAQIITVPPLCPLQVLALDFSQTAALLQRAYQGTRQWLQSGGLDSTDIPAALTPHHH